MVDTFLEWPGLIIREDEASLNPRPPDREECASCGVVGCARAAGREAMASSFSAAIESCPVEITLALVADAYTFRRGDPVCCVEGIEPPRLPILRRLWRRLTRWRQSRYEVDSVQVAAGKLGLVRMRWSWRRWRWERA